MNNLRVNRANSEHYTVIRCANAVEVPEYAGFNMSGQNIIQIEARI